MYYLYCSATSTLRLVLVPVLFPPLCPDFFLAVQVTVQTLPNIAGVGQSCTSLIEGGKRDANIPDVAS